MNSSVDPAELSHRYMNLYNGISEEYRNSGIQDVVLKLNESLRKKNMKEANEYYSKVLNWNFKVANLEGGRKALNIQFSYLRLPSAMMFTVVYDENEKAWKFNV